MPSLARIALYPIKSVDAVCVRQARLLPSGALEHDRRFALVDPAGSYIHAKSTPLIHRVRCAFDLPARTIVLSIEGESTTFHVDSDRPALLDWLSAALAMPVRLVENAENGFPDDLDSPGPTIVSTATLAAVAGWFGMNIDEVRLRFRANLEIDGVEAFWEDGLCVEHGSGRPCQLGEAVLVGTNPCQRCVVPSRHPATGEVLPGFAKTFAEHRERMLPAWAPRSRFDHFYRLSTNTRLAKDGMLRIGDEVRIVTGPGR